MDTRSSIILLAVAAVRLFGQSTVLSGTFFDLDVTDMICVQTSTAGAYVHFRIDVREGGMVYICGYGKKESLLNAKFYLEKHTGGALEKYTLEEDRKENTLHKNRKYRGDECTILTNIPRGEHILTVEHTLEGKYSAISHIVTW